MNTDNNRDVHMEILCSNVGTIVEIEWNYFFGPTKVPHIGPG